jgi:hypothetical protein
VLLDEVLEAALLEVLELVLLEVAADLRAAAELLALGVLVTVNEPPAWDSQRYCSSSLCFVYTTTFSATRYAE